MAINTSLRIGLFGFGVVGEGLYKALQQTPTLQATIVKICIKNKEKKRNAPADLFTLEKDDILNDTSINVVVEVIDDTAAAFTIVKTALLNGKAVVSASKKMIAENLPELLQLQLQTQLPFLYEASACASIPVIRNLEEYFDNDLLHSIKGIINGSTNFILTKMFEEKLSFTDALLLAQQLGFAESNPTLDVEGFDAANKWSILLAHAYGIVIHPNKLLFNGIQNIQSADALVAKDKGYEIKLVASAKKLSNGKVAAYVLPQFVSSQNPLSFVRNEYNGAVIESSFADKQFFYGKGAGSFPTASAVLSDIGALRYSYRYEYKKLYHQTPHTLDNNFYLRTYISFENLQHIPKEKLEWVEEWHSAEGRSYIVAVLHVKHLAESNWWREKNVSLILHEDAIIENIDIVRVKKKSLELAGL
jgi:homoserine dehydrogenase